MTVDFIYYSNNYGATWIKANWGSGDPHPFALTSIGSDLYALTNYEGIWRRPLSDFGVSSVADNTQNNLRFSPYPNPTTGQTIIHNAEGKIFSITVTNIFGEKVLEIPKTSTQEVTLDLSKVPSGVYVTTVIEEGSVVVNRVIKQ